jgi:low affinity Fe/Cu permease
MKKNKINSAKIHVSQHVGWFDRFARQASLFCGRPAIFFLAAATVEIWAITGPIFDFSDTWQLVINTGTTIITFLMVFLIQNTQNRDSVAIQVKLAELIMAVKGAENRLAAVEELSEGELKELQEGYRLKAQSPDGAQKKNSVTNAKILPAR